MYTDYSQVSPFVLLKKYRKVINCFFSCICNHLIGLSVIRSMMTNIKMEKRKVKIELDILAKEKKIQKYLVQENGTNVIVLLKNTRKYRFTPHCDPPTPAWFPPCHLTSPHQNHSCLDSCCPQPSPVGVLPSPCFHR